MPPAVTRELSIAYGAVTLGGTSAVYFLHGDPPYRIYGDYERTTVEATVIVRDSTEALFETQCAALEVEFRKPNQALTVTIGATTFTNLTHSGNTGMLARPSFEKPGSKEFDSARSRLYRISVTVVRPADLTGKNGLREARFNLVTAPTGARHLIVTGSYTASGSNSAKVQYDAQIAGLLASIEDDFSGVTWERDGGGNEEYDDEYKLLRFRRVSTEVLFNQASGTLDHVAIRNQSFTVLKTKSGPGDADLGVERAIELVVSYDADIVASETKDLKGFWESTIKPWITKHVKDVANASTVAIVRSAPQFDYPRNRISAALQYTAISGSSVIMRQVSIEESTDEGVMLWPVWDGKPYSRVLCHGPKRLVRSVTVEEIRLGGAAAASSGKSGGGRAGVGGRGTGTSSGAASAPGIDAIVKPPNGFIVLRRTDRTTPSVIGLRELNYQVVHQVVTVIMEFAEVQASRGGATPGAGAGAGAGAGSGVK